MVRVMMLFEKEKQGTSKGRGWGWKPNPTSSVANRGWQGKRLGQRREKKPCQGYQESSVVGKRIPGRGALIRRGWHGPAKRKNDQEVKSAAQEGKGTPNQKNRKGPESQPMGFARQGKDNRGRFTLKTQKPTRKGGPINREPWRDKKRTRGKGQAIHDALMAKLHPTKRQKKKHLGQRSQKPGVRGGGRAKKEGSAR